MKRTWLWLKANRGTVLWVLCAASWLGFCAYLIATAPEQPRNPTTWIPR